MQAHRKLTQLAARPTPGNAGPTRVVLSACGRNVRCIRCLPAANELGRRLDSQTLDLRLEIVTHVDAMVVAQPQARRDAGPKATEVFVHSLADRLQCFKPSSSLDRMDSHTFRCAVINAGKDGDRTFGFGEGRGGIGTPYLIWRLGHDGPFMRVAAPLLRLPCG